MENFNFTYRGKLNSVLLLVLIAFVVLAIKIMLQDPISYFGVFGI
jgi:hypothetical protein